MEFKRYLKGLVFAGGLFLFLMTSGCAFERITSLEEEISAMKKDIQDLKKEREARQELIEKKIKNVDERLNIGEKRILELEGRTSVIGRPIGEEEIRGENKQ